MSNVPDEYKNLEALSASEIEAEIQKLRAVNERELTEEQLMRAVALHTIARRKTAGPPKSAKTPVKEMSVADLKSFLDA